MGRSPFGVLALGRRRTRGSSPVGRFSRVRPAVTGQHDPSPAVPVSYDISEGSCRRSARQPMARRSGHEIALREEAEPCDLGHPVCARRRPCRPRPGRRPGASRLRPRASRCRPSRTTDRRSVVVPAIETRSRPSRASVPSSPGTASRPSAPRIRSRSRPPPRVSTLRGFFPPWLLSCQPRIASPRFGSTATEARAPRERRRTSVCSRRPAPMIPVLLPTPAAARAARARRRPAHRAPRGVPGDHRPARVGGAHRRRAGPSSAGRLQLGGAPLGAGADPRSRRGQALRGQGAGDRADRRRRRRAHRRPAPIR